MNIRVTKTTHPMELTPSDKLGFGIHYTDHMFIMDYSDEKGWYDPRIVPFQNISLSPARIFPCLRPPACSTTAPRSLRV